MGILEFSNVSKGYGDRSVLRNLSLSVKKDEFLAILGFSGSGKTTLINLMAGLTLPDRGEVRFKGAVARALAMQPEVMLMDEPLSALDALTRANVAAEIEAIWATDRRTMVLVTNDVDEALVLADRILCLNPDGTLGADFAVPLAHPRDRAMLEEGAVKTLRADVTAYLMDVGIAAKVAETRRLPAVTPRHALPRAYAEAARAHTDARYVRFSQLYKTYATPKGPLTVVENFELTLKKGEFISLIGHSGCGKSTVLSMAAGLNGISQGAIALDGKHVEGPDPERAVVFQSPSLFPWLTARAPAATCWTTRTTTTTARR